MLEKQVLGENVSFLNLKCKMEVFQKGFNCYGEMLMPIGETRERIRDFFIGLEFVPIFIYNFIVAWLSVNSTVKKATKNFHQKMSEMNLPAEVVEKLTRDYASIKDHIFDDLLSRKEETQAQSANIRKNERVSTVLLKTLPGYNIYLERKRGERQGLKSAFALESTKTVILTVSILRAIESDVYWVAVCIATYALYSSIFGFASELFINNKVSVSGLTGNIMKTLGEVLSDTKVITIVGLALSSHVIIGAPFNPYYHQIYGLDAFGHYISGLGIGLFATKLYRTFISHVSYTTALTSLGWDKLTLITGKFEGIAELPFVLYSSIGVGLLWEAMEEIFEKFTPRLVNIFFWNGVTDLFVNALGALTAYVLVSRNLIIKGATADKNT